MASPLDCVGSDVEPGARIGLYVRRSCDAIAAMLGTLRAGCTYVPVDPGAPVERNAEIHTDCGVRLTIVEERFEAGYRQATQRLGATDRRPSDRVRGAGARHPRVGARPCRVRSRASGEARVRAVRDRLYSLHVGHHRPSQGVDDEPQRRSPRSRGGAIACSGSASATCSPTMRRFTSPCRCSTSTRARPAARRWSWFPTRFASSRGTSSI